MEWRFSSLAPTSAEDAYMRMLRDIWGWTDHGLLWVRQSASNLRDAPGWWAEYTHEVGGRELTIHEQGEPLTLTFYEPESATVRVVFALLVRVYHNASGLFLERISYPDGTLALALRGLLDTTPGSELDAAWRGREILAHIAPAGPGRPHLVRENVLEELANLGLTYLTHHPDLAVEDVVERHLAEAALTSARAIEKRRSRLSPTIRMPEIRQRMARKRGK